MNLDSKGTVRHRPIRCRTTAAVVGGGLEPEVRIIADPSSDRAGAVGVIGLAIDIDLTAD
jgi:hypothetical protein